MIDLSVLICTHCRPEWLAELLGDLGHQPGAPSFEVVVVDNDPEASAEGLCAATPAVRYLREPRRGVSHARNTALEAARADVVLFLDDDQRIARDALANIWHAWSERPPDTAGLRLRVLLRPENAGLPGSTPPAATTPTGAVSRAQFGTGGLVLARHAIESLAPPFDPDFGLTGGEDTDFYVRATAAGLVFRHSPATTVYERVPAHRASWRYRVAREYRAGRLDHHINDKRAALLPPIPPSGGLRGRIDRWVFGDAASRFAARVGQWWNGPERLQRAAATVAYRVGVIHASLARQVSCKKVGSPMSSATERWS